MRWITNRIAHLGDYLMGLSESARAQLLIGVLLLLGGGGLYKLLHSLDRLREPLPAPSTQELIGPMQRLFSDTKNNLQSDQKTRQRELSRLDSLATVRTNQPQIP